ncbi:MAG TPA: hypothetical protein ENJ95_06970 [Bacteroidetes bacterium]|nr:hypothetical protein [Bacteroidota bacterium]
MNYAKSLKKIAVNLPSGEKLSFQVGEYSELQKSIIEEFLPRYGHGAEVLSVGNATDESLFLNKKKLEELNFFDPTSNELPDIIAFSKNKNWLYLIETVYGLGIINEIRLLQLKKMTINCKAEIIYVTAFNHREDFRKITAAIAWETDVWIANEPDHLIHFNGDKFLGPYRTFINETIN